MTTRIALTIILCTLATNFMMITYSIGSDFYAGYFNVLSLIIYLLILSFIGVNIYFVLSKNIKTIFFLSCYFVFCLLTTLCEIFYLSSIELGTKNKLFYFLFYFVLFVYITKSHGLKAYFKQNITATDGVINNKG